MVFSDFQRTFTYHPMQIKQQAAAILAQPDFLPQAI
jgi:hypothetical protein